MKVGIIDSGKGGKYIASLLKERFKIEVCTRPTLFYRSYSNMSIDQLKRECREHVLFFKEQDVDFIVIGCMTLSTNLKEYIETISNVQVYDLYSGLPTFSADTLVIGTTNTINSGKFNQYYQMACPDIAPAIEKGYLLIVPGLLRGYESMQKRVHPFSKVILGCSHYSAYRVIFEDYYKGLDIIDPVDYLLTRLDEEINVLDCNLSYCGRELVCHRLAGFQ